VKYHATVFDLDGTLLDTLRDLADTVNHVLSERNFPTHAIDEFREFVGDGARMLVTRALPERARRPDIIEECLTAFRAEYRRSWKRTTMPYPGVPEMLDALTLWGIKKAVLSNKPHEFTQQCVAELLSRWDFDAVTGQREGIPLKPEPTGALDIARRLQIDPAACLYVGDSGVDMQTARSAGMYAVGVLWGYRSADELEARGAHMVIRHPQDLVAFIEQSRLFAGRA
jgi:phosphoglycolate phosphatase